MQQKDKPYHNSIKNNNPQLRKVMYTPDLEGNYHKAPADSTSAELLANQETWNFIEEEITNIVQKVKAGVLSPIPYYMYKKLMDVGILAAHLKKFKWQIRRHFKPHVFAKLKSDDLQKYTQVFEVSLDELINPKFAE